MRVRVAGIADAAAIVAMINAAFRVERFFIDTDRIDLAEVRAHFQTGEFLLAEDAGTLIACVYVELRGDRAYLGLLSVDPSRQRSGVGSSLLAAAEDHCRRRGARFMDLQIVNLRAELPPFYRRHGYVETGEAPFPSDVETRLPCHFVTMSKRLAG